MSTSRNHVGATCTVLNNDPLVSKIGWSLLQRHLSDSLRSCGLRSQFSFFFKSAAVVLHSLRISSSLFHLSAQPSNFCVPSSSFVVAFFCKLFRKCGWLVFLRGNSTFFVVVPSVRTIFKCLCCLFVMTLCVAVLLAFLTEVSCLTSCLESAL